MKNKIMFVICLLFGLMFINAGLNKFFNYMPVPEDMPESMMKVFEAFMTIGWLMPLVAVAEIVGGLFFAIPRFRALGAIVIFPIMVGIILTHIYQAPSGLPMVLVLLAINLWVIFENRDKYLALIKK
ncbi:MAG: DoxX family protein [Flavobacteriales bacterium]|jgi:putative oxidoreductase|nr:DoxX family protein [Flavobacteriales bacterium]|tara:strand:- start:162475 stop:162855 length:381 start_codon:yes stop_codon:yes gene_type:complete